MFFWWYFLVFFFCIRLLVVQESVSNEDDIIIKLVEIVIYSVYLCEVMLKGVLFFFFMEQWEFFQLQVGMYVNSDVFGFVQ